MSASIDASAIFMKDTPNQIKNKITKHAFSGGRDTVEEHREKGGDTAVDVSYAYLRFFLESDEELAKIKEAYETGKMLSGEMKAECIREVQAYVAEFQERRANVTDDLVKDFMSEKPLVYKGNPRIQPLVHRGGDQNVENELKEVGEVKVEGKSKNQLKKEAKEKEIAEKKAAKEAAKANGAA